MTPFYALIDEAFRLRRYFKVKHMFLAKMDDYRQISSFLHHHVGLQGYSATLHWCRDFDHDQIFTCTHPVTLTHISLLVS